MTHPLRNIMAHVPHALLPTLCITVCAQPCSAWAPLFCLMPGQHVDFQQVHHLSWHALQNNNSTATAAAVRSLCRAVHTPDMLPARQQLAAWAGYVQHKHGAMQ
ncbi:hypothetical protein COO60DRAFT_512492 [Scenedesmus sp. NREL 46B-D3]|nr:hypothetical protein COO60DRAFT_512492 [Scenedesmus sp. NREL 46B-D3]